MFDRPAVSTVIAGAGRPQRGVETAAVTRLPPPGEALSARLAKAHRTGYSRVGMSHTANTSARLRRFAALALSFGLLLGGGAGAEGDAVAPPGEPVPTEWLARYVADGEGFTLVDARSPEEYAEAHVTGAVNIPHDAYGANRARLPAAHDTPIVVYCRTGRRAGLLREQLLADGYADVRVLDADRIRWAGDKGTFDLASPPPAPQDAETR